MNESVNNDRDIAPPVVEVLEYYNMPDIYGSVNSFSTMDSLDDEIMIAYSEAADYVWNLLPNKHSSGIMLNFKT